VVHDDDDRDERSHDDPLRAFVLHTPVPVDAQRMGLDRSTEEGAMVAMAGALSPTSPLHRLVALVMLAIFVVPGLLGILSQIF